MPRGQACPRTSPAYGSLVLVSMVCTKGPSGGHPVPVADQRIDLLRSGGPASVEVVADECSIDSEATARCEAGSSPYGNPHHPSASRRQPRWGNRRWIARLDQLDIYTDVCGPERGIDVRGKAKARGAGRMHARVGEFCNCNYAAQGSPQDSLTPDRRYVVAARPLERDVGGAECGLPARTEFGSCAHSI